jgi:hypothetical protein
MKLNFSAIKSKYFSGTLGVSGLAGREKRMEMLALVDSKKDKLPKFEDDTDMQKHCVELLQGLIDYGRDGLSPQTMNLAGQRLTVYNYFDQTTPESVDLFVQAMQLNRCPLTLQNHLYRQLLICLGRNLPESIKDGISFSILAWIERDSQALLQEGLFYSSIVHLANRVEDLNICELAQAFYYSRMYGSNKEMLADFPFGLIENVLRRRWKEGSEYEKFKEHADTYLTVNLLWIILSQRYHGHLNSALPPLSSLLSDDLIVELFELLPSKVNLRRREGQTRIPAAASLR